MQPTRRPFLETAEFIRKNRKFASRPSTAARAGHFCDSCGANSRIARRTRPDRAETLSERSNGTDRGNDPALPRRGRHGPGGDPEAGGRPAEWTPTKVRNRLAEQPDLV